MAESVGAVIPFAVGVGISPIPIIAVILMLFSHRAKVNGPLFLTGWTVGVTAVITTSYLLADALDIGADSSPDDEISWPEVVVGVLLVVAACWKWAKRPKAGEEATVPRWMNEVDHFTPAKAFGLAVVLSANPKNLALAVAAGATVARLDPATAEVAAAIVAFTVIGSAIVAVAVGYDIVGGRRARARLDQVKVWMTRNNSAVMAVLFLVFGVVLIVQGLGLVT